MDVVACATIEVKRIVKILCGEATLLGKAFRRQVVSIAIGGYLADLDQALFGATFEIAIDQPQGNAEP